MNLPRAVLAVSIIAALLLLVAGPGTRMAFWDFRTGFGVLRWAVYVGAAGALIAAGMLLAPSLRKSSGAMLVIALLIGLCVAAVPLNAMRLASKVPAIHDISTDTRNPPEFVAILPLRANAPNPAAYGGAEIASEQQRAYPELRSYQMPLSPAQAFERALQTASAMGWDIVASDSASGRIEASDTTRWFGFIDDVVIRIEGDASGSRVDVRSVSRVGKSDLGTNARRIRTYLQRLAQ